MATRRTGTQRNRHGIAAATARRITFGGHAFACYDQQPGQRAMVVMEERIIQLSATTYALFVALLERAAQPNPDGIVSIHDLLVIAMLGKNEAPERQALRKRLYQLRTKLDAFGLEIACVQERHAAVGYVLRVADEYTGRLSA